MRGKGIASTAFAAANVGAVLMVTALGVLLEPASIDRRAGLFVFGILTAATGVVIFKRLPNARSYRLIFFQATVLVCLVGGLAPFQGAPAEDAMILGAPLGRWAHGLIALGGASLVDHFVPQNEGVVPRRLAVGLTTLGVCSGVQMVNYAIHVLCAPSRPGNYEAFGQELVADLAGVLAWYALALAHQVIRWATARNA